MNYGHKRGLEKIKGSIQLKGEGTAAWVAAHQKLIEVHMETTPLSVIEDVRKTLEAFQAGYTRRDVTCLEEFMALFVPEAEVEIIGTGAIRPGDEEWSLGRKAVADLIENDWNYWGDVKIGTGEARIHVSGRVAWLSASGTVTRCLKPEQTYKNYLEYVQRILNDKKDQTPEQTTMDILRFGTQTASDGSLGETFIWPFRFTAVLLMNGQGWRFQQIQFSFPTTRLPDVRYTS